MRVSDLAKFAKMPELEIKLNYTVCIHFIFFLVLLNLYFTTGICLSSSSLSLSVKMPGYKSSGSITYVKTAQDNPTFRVQFFDYWFGGLLSRGILTRLQCLPEP